MSPDDNHCGTPQTISKKPIVVILPIRFPIPNRSWALSHQEKANVFAEHLAKMFAAPANTSDEDAEILHYPNAPCQLSPSIKPFSLSESTWFRLNNCRCIKESSEKNSCVANHHVQ